MSGFPSNGGLSLEQAPPLAVPAGFFLTAPWAIGVAGALLLEGGSELLLSRWSPATMALAHLGTLGVVGMVMLGALYQMVPVVAGASVAHIRLGHLVHALLLGGLALFCPGLLAAQPDMIGVGAALIGVAMLLFLVPVGGALLGAPTVTHTVHGMRLALLALAAVVALGLWAAFGLATGQPGAGRAVRLEVHLNLALLGWIGGLLVAVSWQVVPMFYLAAAWPARFSATLLGLLGTSVLLLLLGQAADLAGVRSLAPLYLRLACLPAVLAVWIMHPLSVMTRLAQRQRRRSDASLLFWYGGMVTALLIAVGWILWACAPGLFGARGPVLFAWLVLWGWAGLVLHGMLTRIVPFLVWFHRYSARIGLEAVPSIRELLPQGRIRAGFFVHLASLVVGGMAIFSGNDVLARLTGLLLLAVAVMLFSALVHVLQRRPVTSGQASFATGSERDSMI